jgi:hypothetical protein
MCAQVVQFGYQQTQLASTHDAPVHVHPSSLVKLFMDCLREVRDAPTRRALLADAMAPNELFEGRDTHQCTGGDCYQAYAGQMQEECSQQRPSKRARYTGPSELTAVVSGLATGAVSSSPWGLLMAQACHDELLRWGLERR